MEMPAMNPPEQTERDVKKAERRHEREVYEKLHPAPEPTRHRDRDDDRRRDRSSGRDRGGGFGL
jgi:hypothetical protein